MQAQQRRAARIIRELAPADEPPRRAYTSPDAMDWSPSREEDDPPLWMHLAVFIARIILP